MPEPRVELFTRVGCSLCDEAQVIVAEVCAAHDASWRAIDVDTDPQLRAKYTDHVPVIHVDGSLLSYWYVQPETLSRALAGGLENRERRLP